MPKDSRGCRLTLISAVTLLVAGCAASTGVSTPTASPLAIRTADLVVQTSHPDSCGPAIAEAAAAGDTLAEHQPAPNAQNPMVSWHDWRDSSGRKIRKFILTYLITRSGSIDTSTVRMTPAPDPEFRRRLWKDLATWRFRPAIHQGCYVAWRERDDWAVYVDVRR